jgi:hypothetical protein
MKKIAILLRGIAYTKSYSSFRGGNRHIDYTKCLESLHEYVIENNQVDFYLHTWKTPELNIEELLDTYKPIAYQVDEPITCENQKRTQYYSCNQSIQRVLKLFLDNSVDKDYDYIIITRYDLKFFYPFSKFNLEPNTTYTMNRNQLTSEDNFLVLSRDFIPKYQLILHNYRFFSHHKAIEKIINIVPTSIYGDEPIKYNNQFYGLGWSIA